jgi:hypothetical protein
MRRGVADPNAADSQHVVQAAKNYDAYIVGPRPVEGLECNLVAKRISRIRIEGNLKINKLESSTRFPRYWSTGDEFGDKGSPRRALPQQFLTQLETYILISAR